MGLSLRFYRGPSASEFGMHAAFQTDMVCVIVDSILVAYTYHEIGHPSAMELTDITFSIVHSTPISSSGSFLWPVELVEIKDKLTLLIVLKTNWSRWSRRLQYHTPQKVKDLERGENFELNIRLSIFPEWKERLTNT